MGVWGRSIGEWGDAFLGQDDRILEHEKDLGTLNLGTQRRRGGDGENDAGTLNLFFAEASKGSLCLGFGS